MSYWSTFFTDLINKSSPAYKCHDCGEKIFNPNQPGILVDAEGRMYHEEHLEQKEWSENQEHMEYK